MNVYFKINPADDSIIEVLEKNNPIPLFNTKTDSQTNGKPFLVEAVVTDPSYDPATQTKSGPVDAYDGTDATRVYSVAAITVDLDDYKLNARIQIDGESELTRLRFITNGAGQAMAYQEKADEATDYVVAGYPADLTSYPFIQAEVNATGKNATQAADDILATRSAWIAVSAAIEEIRLGAKKQVNEAANTGEIDTIVTNATTALEGI